VGIVDRGQARPGQPVVCPRCGHTNICPEAAGATVAASGRSGSSRAPWAIAIVVLLLAVGAWVVWAHLGPEFAGKPSRTKSPAETLQAELLEQNLGAPGDPELEALYQTIAAAHFDGRMPPTPVRWEPRLAQVGLLAVRAFTLEGMFGHVGSKTVILLNPDLQRQREALVRALCHEMVHAYLYATGDTTTDHGPAFQVVLQRLSSEGAFEGIMATEQERSALKAWIDSATASIDATRRELETLAASVETERVAIEAAIADANARGAVTEAEARTLNARREAYNQLALDANERSAHAQAERDHYNREVTRYNLMLVYPDGIDEHGGAEGP
jgi:hypothetical protein